METQDKLASTGVVAKLETDNFTDLEVLSKKASENVQPHFGSGIS